MMTPIKLADGSTGYRIDDGRSRGRVALPDEIRRAVELGLIADPDKEDK